VSRLSKKLPPNQSSQYVEFEDRDWQGILAQDLHRDRFLNWFRETKRRLFKGARGQRNGKFQVPDGQYLFLKQYHHGGVIAEKGDVYYDSPDRFYDELNATLMARSSGIPVPEPIAVLANQEPNGWLGYYISEALDYPLISREVRLQDKPELLSTAGEVLARLHEEGIDHRDYHVQNCLVSNSDDVVVTDFDPVEFRPPNGWVRCQRIHRFIRSLRKYGFRDSDADRFIQGYRSVTRIRDDFFWLQKPLFSIKNTASDIRYSVMGDQPWKSIDFEKILVRAPNWLGDAVMSLPFIEWIDDHRYNGRVDVVTRSEVSELFRYSPAVEKTWTIEDGKKWYLPEGISEERYSLAISIPKSLRTAFQLVRSGIPRRLGFATQGRSALLTDRVPLNGKDREIHHALLYMSLGPNIETGKTQISDPVLEVPHRLLDETRERFGLPESFLTIHPGSAYGPAKRWTPEHFNTFLKKIISKTSDSIVALGVDSERQIAREVLRSLPDERIHNLVGQTSLEECMAVLAEGRGTVANDSGIMHLSAALGRPTLGIFGSSSPELTSPLGPRTEVLYRNVSCSPCFERECPLTRERYKCLTELKPSNVFESWSDLISDR